MGAESISFELDGKLNFSEVKQAFKDQQNIDKDRNGHRDGYSGDFQTVNTVKDHSYKEVFENFTKAFDYCINVAEKWEYVVAVKYKTKNGIVKWLVAGWGAC